MRLKAARGFWPEGRQCWAMPDEYRPGLVSVIIPAYNRAHVLPEALESVSRQTYRPVEVIVVDDGSTDTTRAVVEEFRVACEGDSSCTVRYVAQENQGAPAARNRGLVESQGEYIQFLDSDDLLHPRKLAEQVTRLTCDADLDLAYSGTAYFTTSPDWGAPALAGLAAGDAGYLPGILAGIAWNTVSGVYRRRACRAVGPWDERAPFLQDWDYAIRLVLSDARIAYVSETLSLCRQTAGGGERISNSRHSEARLRDMYDLAHRWVDWIRDAGRLDAATERGLANVLFSVTKRSLLSGHTELARDAVGAVRRLRTWPTSPDRFAIYAVLAWMPSPWGCRVARGLRRTLHPESGRW